MSATIVYEKTREPMWLESGLPISADVERRWNEMVGNLRSKFQLWERVAETPSNAPAPLTARQDAGIVRAYQRVESRAEFDRIKRMQGAPVGNYGTNGPRAMIDGEYTAPRHASGIIRAGVRIK